MIYSNLFAGFAFIIYLFFIISLVQLGTFRTIIFLNI